MKDSNYDGGPVAGYFVLDNKTDRLQNARLTNNFSSSQEMVDMLGECLYYGIAGSDAGARMVRYDFPDLYCIPEWSKHTADIYYLNLRSVLDEKGITPKVEIHSNEMLYCMLNNLPLRIDGDPSASVRLRDDYAEQCKTFPERLREIADKELQVLFPNKEARIGLKNPTMFEELLRTRSVPSLPVKPPRQGI